MKHDDSDLPVGTLESAWDPELSETLFQLLYKVPVGDRDLSVDQLFEIHDDIATRVALSLSATILPSERRDIDVKPTNNLAAYDLYLRGQASLYCIGETE